MPADKTPELPTVKMTTVDSVVNWQLPLLAILFVAVIFVAIKTVVHRHESRTLFMQLQVLEKDRDKLAARWSRLKLEQGTMLNQVRVERNARLDLGMKMPKASEIKTIRESEKEMMVVTEIDAKTPAVLKASKVALGN
ncbi:MAG: cell division protein FtsL [Cocleimonas sp.]|nr:cell division protein FtsL [Cocleimonas sp.]